MPHFETPQEKPEDRVNEGQTMIGNRDGKFIERLIPSLLSAGIAVAGMAILFWSDSRANDREAAAAILSLNQKVEKLERTAEVDRQKTNELTADVKVILAIMQRIERNIDGARPIPQR